MSRSPRYLSHLHPVKAPRRMLALATLLAGLIVCGSVVHAITTGTVTLDSIEGNGWLATGIAIDVDLQAEPIKASARIKRLRFSALGSQAGQTLRDVRIDCPRLELEGEAIACAAAHIRGVFPGIGKQDLSGGVRFNRRTQALAFGVANIKLGGGVARVSGEWRDQGWLVNAQLTKGSVADLKALAKQWFPNMAAFSATGAIDVDLELHGSSSAVRSVKWRVQAQQLVAANEAGSVATDGLSFDAHGSLNKLAKPRSAGAWSFTASLTSTHGQAYAEPIFLNFKENALTLDVAGDWLGAGRIALREFSVEHDKALSASGHATLAFGDALQVELLHADIRRAELPGAYALYLQPFLLNSALGSLATRGSLSGVVDVAANVPTALTLDMRDVSADDTHRRWSVSGSSGVIRWRKERDTTAKLASALKWQRAQVLGIDIGAAAVQFVTADRDFEITQATRIPILDGSIELTKLQVERAGQPDMAVQLDATLQPVSVQQLCAVFDWPQFGGRIGGRIANLRLRNGVMTLGTVLHADVFDGRVSIADLRVEQPFGNWPRFAASIAIDRVDLEQVTSAFSFGMITGRLSGTIANLQLFNWSPVAFEANLYTPPDDRSAHRISQRAVRNIGSLGGSGSGVAAALSTGFLRFFENFNYERLGISCKLENEICTMQGVEPAKNGYYLVKGRGVPRIDVIANATRVDWPRLVKQLQAATQSQGPQVSPPVSPPVSPQVQ